MKTHTALLTPLQVKEAIVLWARYNFLIGNLEEVALENVELRKDGSAAIRQTGPKTGLP